MISRLKRSSLPCLTAMLMLALSSLAQSQTGSSIPFFEIDTLVIPRIDVEGYGALKISLKLEDETALTFSISEAIEADGSMTPAATYDLDSTVLSVPLAHVDFDFYSLEFVLVPGDLFQLSAIEAAPPAGQADYNAQCAGCHGSDAQGGSVAVSLVNCANCGSVDALSGYINNVMPLGAAGNCVDDCATEVADYILSVFQVDDSPLIEQTLSAIQVLPLQDSLRKASLQLVSRLPSAAEKALVENEGEAGLRQALDGMMTEQAFYDRLGEIFNDLLHTDRYLSANSRPGEALNLMRPFPDAFWMLPELEEDRDLEVLLTLIAANDSVAREPLELIKHIVRNDLPMTEILTADYFMVNGYSAKSYGVFDELSFADEWDPEEWQVARLNDIPHAGLLTSLMFQNRYPSSATNRNRARSRVTYDLFLDVDILGLEGSRPDGEAVDISSPAPTMENDDCVVCHGLLDPVASSFQNWNQVGYYLPFRPWYEDMFQAGFAGIDRPDEERFTSLQWLAGQIETDPRFNDAMVRIVYKGLTGQEPLDPPFEEAPQAEWDAYNAESVHLDELKAIFTADNQNLKTLIREIVLSPYWRAAGIEDSGFAVVHEETGAARLLAPELLHRKIAATLGFEWRSPLDWYYLTKDLPSEARLLDARNYYQQIYGGIDSFTITERLTEPNGLMSAVQERMANELACYAVSHDFLKDPADRLLFPYVEIDTLPDSSDGSAAIFTNIVHLHSHFLGEELPGDDLESELTFQLFLDVQALGAEAVGVSETVELPPLCRRGRELESGADLAAPLTDDPDYTMRAWMAVLAYLLSDYRFVYE